MMKKIFKYLAFFVGGLILLAIIFSGKEEEKTFTANKPEVVTPIYTKIQGEKEAFEFLMDSSFFLGSLGKHRIFFETIERSAELIKEGEKSMIDSSIQMANEFKKLLIKSQKSLFPKIRKEYLEETKSRLWTQDIKLNYSGTGNTQIALTGALFAANQNKQTFQEGIHTTMMDYRFKKVSYKWFQYDEDGAYYTINSKKDDEL